MSNLFRNMRFAVQRASNAIRAVKGARVLGSLSFKGVAAFVHHRKHVPRGPSAIVTFYAHTTPDQMAVVDGNTRLSYASLDARINRISNLLLELGTQPGDRVGLMMRNCFEYLAASWAINRVGAVAVQIGYRLTPNEVVHILENSAPRAIFCHHDLIEVVRNAQTQINEAKTTELIGVPDDLATRLAEQSDEPPARREGDEAGGLMIYTSGTTGKPKGAEREMSRAQHPAVIDFVRQIGVRHDDRHLVVCPLYHSAAPALAAFMFLFGATVVIRENFEPEDTLRTIERERITSAFFVPTMLAQLSALPEEVRGRYDLSTLRCVLTGAAPLPTETARRFEAVFGPILYNFYGATETGLVTLALPGEHTAHPGTIGRALFGNDIRLLDDDGNDVPAGEPGEFFVQNSMLVSGYHKNKNATDSALKQGFFSVGDVGHVDSEGFYYLDDRKIDMVISGGVNIYPMEIEQHLHNHPAVLEAAVIGVPDDKWGEALKAFVVLCEGQTLTEADVLEHCRGSLAGYKCPKHIAFLDVLPRTPTGKTLKRELRKL